MGVNTSLLIKLAIGCVLFWALLWVTSLGCCKKVEGNEMAPAVPRETYKIVFYTPQDPATFAHKEMVFYEFLPLSKQQQSSFVGRVIAREGDRIKIEKGTIYVNGEAIDEPYVMEKMNPDESLAEIIVPRGMLFVLGDNRSQAKNIDSRYIGPLHTRTIIGKFK